MALKDLLISIFFPPIIHCDNLGAISLASNPVFHARTKHVEVYIHFIREKVQNRDISICFIPQVDQLANLFTNCIFSSQFCLLRDKFIVFESPYSLAGDVDIAENQHVN